MLPPKCLHQKAHKGEKTNWSSKINTYNFIISKNICSTFDKRELNDLNKAIKRAVRSDIRAYNTQIIAKTIKDNKGQKF